MEGIRTDRADESAAADVEYAAVVTNLASRRIMRRSPSDPPLRCVSSGYLSHGCSCRATIPTGVVTDAWARERRAGAHGDRFFSFTWGGGVWLGYGLKSGQVRGVYCPEHSAERDQRSPTEAAGERGARRTIALTG
ncbi:MAG: hypothetical protein JWO23_1292 [Solirubrobacterales bacterium]|jgi:hypothetical protein|nr:hypothetical protein [Solirubrobacterales bacterium]